jgi:cytochrome c-type biogenesis protein CcmF
VRHQVTVNMAADLGNLLLYIATVLSAIIIVYPLSAVVSGKSLNSQVVQTVKILWIALFACAVGSFFCLIWCYIISDFSVLNVANNSHTDKPLLYKISAAWGNHEGSMLLWLSAISFFSVLFGSFGRVENKAFLVGTLCTQGVLAFFFLCYVVFTSSPFIRIFPPVLNGLGLNPLLQDIGLAFHPPMLYLGYVGLSIAYSGAVGLLLAGSQGPETKIWARSLQPWVLLSWSFLTLGIGLGSWWAYRELGWGGFWFWDPVENASLMPWLSATALIHCLSVGARSGQLKHWSLFLAILTFSFSMVGTFLVRSGVITSVHSFAHDPERGVVILFFIGFSSLLLLGLYLLQLPKLTQEQPQNISLNSKTGLILLNNLLLIAAAAVVVLGTLYPLLLEMLTEEKISVGAPYFNLTFSPFGVATAILGSLLILLPFKKVRLLQVVSLLVTLTAALTYLITVQLFHAAGIIAGIFLIASSLFIGIRLSNQGKVITSGGMLLAHIGIGIAVLAVSANAAFKEEVEQQLKYGESLNLAGYQLTLKEVKYFRHENYVSRTAIVKLISPHGQVSELGPEIRIYPIEEQQTPEAAIHHTIMHDLYLAIGHSQTKEAVIVKAYYQPLISWLWLSCFLMFCGGMWSFIRMLKK